MLHSCVEVVPAFRAERLAGLSRELPVEAAQQALIVDAHGLEEAHLELLAVAAQLRGQAVAL